MPYILPKPPSPPQKKEASYISQLKAMQKFIFTTVSYCSWKLYTSWWKCSKSFRTTWLRTKLSLEQNNHNKQATYFDWTTVDLSWYQTSFLQNLMIQSSILEILFQSNASQLSPNKASMEYIWQIAQPITDRWVKSTVYLKFPSRITRFIKMNINNNCSVNICSGHNDTNTPFGQ